MSFTTREPTRQPADGSFWTQADECCLLAPDSDCGFTHFQTPDLKEKLKSRKTSTPAHRAMIDSLAGLEFSDPAVSVVEDVEFLRGHPLILEETNVVGWKYEVSLRSGDRLDSGLTWQTVAVDDDWKARQNLLSCIQCSGSFTACNFGLCVRLHCNKISLISLRKLESRGGALLYRYHQFGRQHDLLQNKSPTEAPRVFHGSRVISRGPFPFPTTPFHHRTHL